MAEQEFARWDPQKKYTYVAQPTQYSTALGLNVNLFGLEIDYFLNGIMEGHPDAWRAHVLNRVRRMVSLVVKEPPDGVIPRYIIRATIGDCRSKRTVCWFDNELVDLESQIVENLGGIDWAKETAGDPPIAFDDY
jgi:hypothetical protein